MSYCNAPSISTVRGYFSDSSPQPIGECCGAVLFNATLGKSLGRFEPDLARVWEIAAADIAGVFPAPSVSQTARPAATI
jgi:hypothetical protein